MNPFSPEALRSRIGGTIGRHADPRSTWLQPVPWAIIAAIVTWLVAMLRQVPCNNGANSFQAMCYTDVTALYMTRGLADGAVPYATLDWEYPVLSGAFVELTRRLTALLGFPQGPGLTQEQLGEAAIGFFAITAVLLFTCFLLTVVAHIRLAPGHEWTVLALAASPLVMANGLINWDLLAVCLTAWALVAWAARRPWLAGIAFGLAIAAKLYPLVILGPLFLLCLRAGRLPAFAKTLAAAVLAWTAVNLPVYLVHPKGWLYFWTFNVDRGGDLGSLWYVLQLAGSPVGSPGLWSLFVMVVLCLLIAWLVLRTQRRPRLGQVAFLVVAAFLVANKVYSPQYVLWLLPLLLLARPKVRELAVFTIAELTYFLAIWAHLAGWLKPGDGGPDRLYWLAVFLRIGATLWVSAVVVVDILSPEEDPLRQPIHTAAGWKVRDDEIGGVLDQAPDVLGKPRQPRAPDGRAPVPVGPPPVPDEAV